MTRLSSEDMELERRFQEMPLFMDALPAEGGHVSTDIEAIQALVADEDPNGELFFCTRGAMQIVIGGQILLKT